MERLDKFLVLKISSCLGFLDRIVFGLSSNSLHSIVFDGAPELWQELDVDIAEQQLQQRQQLRPKKTIGHETDGTVPRVAIERPFDELSRIMSDVLGTYINNRRSDILSLLQSVLRHMPRLKIFKATSRSKNAYSILDLLERRRINTLHTLHINVHGSPAFKCSNIIKASGRTLRSLRLLGCSSYNDLSAFRGLLLTIGTSCTNLKSLHIYSGDNAASADFTSVRVSNSTMFIRHLASSCKQLHELALPRGMSINNGTLFWLISELPNLSHLHGFFDKPAIAASSRTHCCTPAMVSELRSRMMSGGVLSLLESDEQARERALAACNGLDEPHFMMFASCYAARLKGQLSYCIARGSGGALKYDRE